MASGFCPALLVNINDVANGNSPSKKLQIAGFLSMLMCCQNSSVNPVNDQFNQNTIRPLTVKYARRPTLSDVSYTDTCDIDRQPTYNEWTLPNMGFASSSFFIDDATLNQYCIDASQMTRIGGTSVTQEVYDRIVETANIVMKAINVDLVGQMATKFGYNATTHHPTGKVININQDGSKLILDNGIIDLMRDIQENEICGDPCFVGGGLWEAWNQAKIIACCNSAGQDISKINSVTSFFDKDTQSIWGPNTVGVFAPGSVKFIGRNAYLGAGAGFKGGSEFGTFLLPVQEFGCNLDNCLRDLLFDIQLKYIDCPQNININGVSTAVGRGWQVFISKRYAMWVQPLNGYASDDSLANTNGTLKYYITNNAGADTPPYAYGYTA